MRKRLSRALVCGTCLLATSAFDPGVGLGADAPGWDADRSAKLQHWKAALGVRYGESLSVVLRDSLIEPGEIHRFGAMPAVAAVSVDGRIQLHGRNSLARLILVDTLGREHLVFETYPLLVDRQAVRLQDACEETCLLEAVVPRSLRLDLVNATVRLARVNLASSVGPARPDATSLRRNIKQAQDRAKLERIREQLPRRKLRWTAGETPVSRLTYEEKRKLFMGGVVPNLQGAEYYRGGVFVVESASGQPQAAGDDVGLIPAFDWRSRHGANNPASPYYDGDPYGSGWITSVKDQDGCGSCWAFAATGATEALANLYFNDHLNLDLSEQDALSCSGAGSCSGGFPGSTLNYYTQTGVVDEACFPYVASDVPCDKCADPAELVRISGQIPFPPSWPPTETVLKRMILEYGPLSGGIYSWSHAMTLVGYTRDSTDGGTAWIFKNSWGEGWGDHGYGYLKVDINDVGWTHALLHPVLTSTAYEIACRDEDGDGYYNWGISGAKPAACPAVALEEKDCDDSDAEVGPFDSGGYCSWLAHLDVHPGSCPNPINRGAKGVLPAAIVGTARVPVNRIDIGSITLEGVPPLRYAFEDVARPFDPPTGKTRASDCTGAGPDGRLDLTLKFDLPKVAATLANARKGDIRVLRLHARLKAQYGGERLLGEDVIVIVK